MTTGRKGRQSGGVFPFGSNQAVLDLDAGDVVELMVKKQAQDAENNVALVDKLSLSDVSYVGYRLPGCD